MSLYQILVALVPLIANMSGNVTFVPGPADPNQSTIVANPNTAYANNQNTITIVATAMDKYGNLIANGNIAFGLNANTKTYVQKSGSNGQAQWTIASPNVETDTARATFDNNSSITTTVAFIAGPMNSAMSFLSVSSTNEAANNSNAIIGFMNVRDSSNRVMPNQNVVFSASGTQTTVVTVTNPTNSSGVANANYTSSLAQDENVQALVNGYFYSAPVSFSGNMNTLTLTGVYGGFTGVVSSPNVIAYDSAGRISVGYNGTVVFNSSDPRAIFPASYQFTSSDRGVHNFASQISLVTNGVQSLSVADSATSVTAQQGNLVVFASHNYTLSPNSVSTLCVELANGNSIVGNAITTNVCSSAIRQNIYENSNNNLVIQSLCLAPSSISAGASILAQTCDNTNQTKWIRTSSYQYQSMANTSYCLDANLAVANTGMSLQLCNSSSNTQKLIATPSPPIYRIGLVNSSYCLDDSGGGTTQGTVVQSYTCNNSASQRFGFDQNQAITFMGRCVEFPGSPPVSGVTGVLNACTGAITQKYVFNGNNIVLAANPNLCVNFLNQSNHQIQATTCSTDANQKVMATIGGLYNFWMSAWNPGSYLLYDSSAFYKLAMGKNRINAFSYTVVGAAHPNIWVTNNSRYINNLTENILNTSTYSFFSSQLFYLPSQDANGYFNLVNSACVDANSNNPVTMTTCSASVPSLNFYRIHAAMSFALTSTPSLCVNYANGSFLSTTALEVNSCNSQSLSQRISFMIDNSIRFAGLCATPVSGVQAGSAIQQAPCVDGLPTSQQWILNNQNTIRSMANPNLCWTAASNVAGGLIQLQNCTGSSLQTLTMQ